MKNLIVNLMETVQIIKSGYGGVLPDGNIVDRRKYPDAVPLQKNEMLATPEPKELTKNPGK